MTAFVRFSQRKDLQYFRAGSPGTVGRRRQRIHPLHRSERLGRLHLGREFRPRSSKRGSGSRTFLPEKSRRTWAGPVFSRLFGIQGLPTTPNLTGGFNTQTISGFATSLGRQTSNPQFQNPTSFDPKLNFSKIIGRHSLKTGYEYLDHSHRGSGRESAVRAGHVQRAIQQAHVRAIGPGRRAAPSHPIRPATISPISFSACRAASTWAAILSSNLRQHVHALYVQDDWRVTPKLTVNLGLRWEFATPLYGSRQQLVELRPDHRHDDSGHRRQPV